MIIDADTKPEHKIYYLGAKLISMLKQENEYFDVFDVFEKFRGSESISFPLFYLALDWLFLIEVITVERGRLKKCF